MARQCELQSTAASRKIATPCSNRATSARQAARFREVPKDLRILLLGALAQDVFFLLPG